MTTKITPVPSLGRVYGSVIPPKDMSSEYRVRDVALYLA